nr:unnamed protein product [Callosobruchus chinensis]
MVAEAKKEQLLEIITHETLARIVIWIENNRLSLSPEKTEAIILKGPRKKNIHWQLRVLGVNINPVRQLRYLEVVLDDKRTFGPHIKHVVEKADRRMAALTRILLNVGGPSSTKRAVLCEVIYSIVLYASPIGQERKWIPYVSAAAIQAITGTPPIKLLAEERSRLYRTSELLTQKVREREKELMPSMWQDTWENHTYSAAWTRTLIWDIKSWVKCEHRTLDYLLTQFLTSHGYFGSYTKRMNVTLTNLCGYCEAEDTPEHTIFICERWAAWRAELLDQFENNLK